MFIRSLVVAAGLCGAFGAAQFPAFSQQYMQRLGGAVDALAVVVSNFDASAQSVGLTRDEALAQMTGTAFMDRRQADMRQSIERHVALQQDLAILRGQGPFMRAYHLRHLTDPKIAKGAFGDFEPALPATLAGVIFALVGFTLSASGAAICVSLVRPRTRRLPQPA